MDGVYSCPKCGREYTTPGTKHGSPAALWDLLEHQAKDHANRD
jgi:hypothetical protein